MNNNVKIIKQAIKRCVSMGKHHGFKPEYNNHFLAACLENHTDCIYIELENAEPDFLAILCWIKNMAERINLFCDTNKVNGDEGAEYWLETFLRRHSFVCNFDCLVAK